MNTELPFPITLFESNEEPFDYEAEAKELGFENLDSFIVASKLFRTWCLYGTLVQDEKLWEIINEPANQEETYSGQKLFKLQSSLVLTVNELAHILKDVNTCLNKLRSPVPDTCSGN